MTTTAEKLRAARKQAGKNHDELIREYFREASAHLRGEPLPLIISDDIYIARSDGGFDKISRSK